MRRLVHLVLIGLLVAPPGALQAAAAAPPPAAVFIGENGSRYHTADCARLRFAHESSREMALAQGFSPCLVCRPDEPREIAPTRPARAHDVDHVEAPRAPATGDEMERAGERIAVAPSPAFASGAPEVARTAETVAPEGTQLRSVALGASVGGGFGVLTLAVTRDAGVAIPTTALWAGAGAAVVAAVAQHAKSVEAAERRRTAARPADTPATSTTTRAEREAVPQEPASHAVRKAAIWLAVVFGVLTVVASAMPNT